MTLVAPATDSAVLVCNLEDLEPERGAAALVEGRQVALFRVVDPSGAGDDVYALDNRDPFSGANVMARGIVGSVGEVLTVASPMYKQRFDLRTGICLDDAGARIATWRVEILDGDVHVCPPEPAGGTH